MYTACVRLSAQPLLTATLIILALGAGLLSWNEAVRTTVLTTDSIVYVDTARHLADGVGPRTNVIGYNDTRTDPPQTQWPPLYPVLMGPFLRFGIDPITAGRAVSAVSFGLTVFLLGWWLGRRVSATAGLAAAALVTATPALLRVSGAVLADAPFTLTVVAMAVVSAELLRGTQRYWPWYALGSLVGLGVLLKYLGLPLLAIPVLLPLLALRADRHLRPALRRIGLGLLGALQFILSLVLWNLVVGRPGGGADRAASSQPLAGVLHDLWSTLSHDLTVNALWIGFLILVGLAIGVRLLRRRSPSVPTSIAPLLIVAFTYLAGLTLARWLVETDRIYSRFTVPAYPLLVAAGVMLIHRNLSAWRRGTAALVLVTLSIVAVGWSVKRYDFSTPAYRAQPSTRTRIVEQQTTRRDLIVGPAAREYILFLDRHVMTLDDNPSVWLTSERLAAIGQRWHGPFNRIVVALTPDLDPMRYGAFTADLSRGRYDDAVLTPLTVDPALRLYALR